MGVRYRVQVYENVQSAVGARHPRGRYLSTISSSLTDANTIHTGRGCILDAGIFFRLHYYIPATILHFDRERT